MSEKIKKSQCYDVQTWNAYQAGTLDESVRSAMEAHLLECESCLFSYLSRIESRINEDENLRLGENFTDQVLTAIEKQGNHWQNASASIADPREAKREKESRSSRVTLLISYCAAAGIAMFFWVGGYFDGLSETFGKSVEHLRTSEVLETRAEPQQSLIRTGWTQKMMEQDRPSFIENLINKKE